MSDDLVIGLAAGYDWRDIEPYAVSLARSGYTGKKVLLAQKLTQRACDNLNALGFELLAFPNIDFSHPEMTKGGFFAYVGRFLLIHRYLHDHPNYRFVICADTRDVIFQSDPVVWLEKNIGSAGLVAASEYIRHGDQEGNTEWVRHDFQEVAPWLMSQTVYCSGLISGRAEYVSGLAAAIYLLGRTISGETWGADQPSYNVTMHQKAYADATIVPAFSDFYCINLCVVAFEAYRKMLLDSPPPLWDGSSISDGVNPANMWDYTLDDLRNFAILHQYDRMGRLAQEIREKYSLPSKID